MWTRRRFLEGLPALPVAGHVLADTPGQGSAAGPIPRDFFADLGVRPFINAAGTYTAMTASLMPPEVMAAMLEASTQYVMLDELHDRVGERIATLIRCDAAMVTAGAAAALTIGTAAVLTGTDEQKIIDLPDLTHMKRDVIVQKSHRFAYDHAVRNCGVRLVEVETREDLAAAITSQTAMMLFFNDANVTGRIQDEEFVEIGRAHGIPTFNDCAADVPPVENLWKYTRMGFDLVTFSGGKGLRGPQSAGLLLGRRDLIAAARLNASPNANTIGRGMKVNKEEMIGMLVALELYLAKDHEAERRDFDVRAETVRGSAASVAGVTAEVYVPPIANHVPHVRVSWDPNALGLTPAGVERALVEGEPSIRTRANRDSLMVGVWMMRPGEAEVVARRLREVLERRV